MGHLSTELLLDPQLEQLPMRGSAASVPELRFSLVELDPCTVPHLPSQQLVDDRNTIKATTHVHIIHEREQAFKIQQLFAGMDEGPVLPQAYRAGIRWSPCSPPSPCHTS